MIIITIKHRGGKVYVPLDINSNEYAIFDEAGFNTLIDLGIHPIFRLRQSCVWARSKGKERYSPSANVCVARVLMDCDRGTCVRYLDNDYKNLAFDNLIVTNGMSKKRARDQIRKEFSHRRYELNHIYE
jgi:hypothetical protein